MRPVRFIKSWLIRHVQVFLSTLGNLTRSPAGTLMTAAVIGIALALPAGLYLFLDNASGLSEGWASNSRMSLFLKTELSSQQAQSLQKEILAMPQIQSADLITPEQALEEYRQHSGFADALSVLKKNPLPAVIIIEPLQAYSSPESLPALLDSFRTMPQIDIAQFDLQWVQRLTAILHIIQRGVVILAGLLALAVLLIIGNTIRLAIQNKRAEIEITKLFGATDAFIRRPFLYTGLWYGLMGGLISWLMVSISFLMLSGPVQNLADLYYSDFDLHGLGFFASLMLLAGGAFLGLSGSWIAVGKHLREIQPG